MIGAKLCRIVTLLEQKWTSTLVQ